VEPSRKPGGGYSCQFVDAKRGGVGRATSSERGRGVGRMPTRARTLTWNVDACARFDCW
jgi:hypothetical protein